MTEKLQDKITKRRQDISGHVSSISQKEFSNNIRQTKKKIFKLKKKNQYNSKKIEEINFENNDAFYQRIKIRKSLISSARFPNIKVFENQQDFRAFLYFKNLEYLTNKAKFHSAEVLYFYNNYKKELIDKRVKLY